MLRMSSAAPRPPLPRWAALLLGSVLGPALALGAAGGCSGLTPESEEKEEDDKAKKEYYEESAQTYYEGGKYEAAAAQWKKALLVEPTAQKGRWGYAMSLAKTGTYENLRMAEHIFLTLVTEEWNHPTRGDIKFEVQKDLADVYLEMADLFDRDIRVLDAQLQEPGTDAARGKELREKKQGQIAKRNALLEKAVPLYLAVLERSKDNPYATAGLAKAYLQVGGTKNDEQGVAYAKQYVEIARASQEGWQQQMQDLAAANNGHLTDVQREHYRSKIRGAREKEMKIHLLLGSVYYRHGLFEASAAEYDAVISLDAAYPAAYVERAQAYAGMKNYKRAIQDLQEYLKITDPVRQREPRINAGELLTRYREIAYGKPKDGDPAASLRPADGASPPR
jgi:tetratricopeptide (TPR) repeat protein